MRVPGNEVEEGVEVTLHLLAADAFEPQGPGLVLELNGVEIPLGDEGLAGVQEHLHMPGGIAVLCGRAVSLTVSHIVLHLNRGCGGLVN